MNRPRIFRLFTFVFLFAFASGCIEPYEPREAASTPDILVIDGSINSNDQTATVTITHTIPLTSTDSVEREKHAHVVVEEFGGSQFALTEIFPGVYKATGLTIDTSKKYRLSVTRNSGKTYQSDYIDVIESPPIDSVTWKAGDDIEIMVNSHDDTGKSKYYRWEFVETYKYSAPYLSGFKFDPNTGEITERDFFDRNYYCYLDVLSTEILIGTTNNLSQDVLRDVVVQRIPPRSIKIAQTYSINVKQRVINAAEYNYWLQLQKTTEKLGGLFDPLPGRVLGNIHCTTDNTEAVLGYFGAGAVSEKRLFIRSGQVPFNLKYRPPQPDCKIDSISFARVPKSGYYYIISTYGRPEIGYLFTSKRCIDCTLDGGSAQTPDYWVE